MSRAKLELLLCAWLLATSAAQAADNYAVEPLDSQPAALPDWLSPLLMSRGHRVTLDGEPLLDFWFRSTLPTGEPTAELGIAYGQLAQGLLVGLVHLHAPWTDYRKQNIAAGSYTLRYGVQPADGDHTGQTYFRDFLMLVPLDRDVFVENGAPELEPVVEASKAAASTEHPAVMALYEIYEPTARTQIIENDFEEPVLAVPLAELVLGIALSGYGHGLPPE